MKLIILYLLLFSGCANCVHHTKSDYTHNTEIIGEHLDTSLDSKLYDSYILDSTIFGDYRVLRISFGQPYCQIKLYPDSTYYYLFGIDLGEIIDIGDFLILNDTIVFKSRLSYLVEKDSLYANIISDMTNYKFLITDNRLCEVFNPDSLPIRAYRQKVTADTIYLWV